MQYPYEISKEFAFSAAHSLPFLPPDHKCHRLHGHNYIVVLVLGSDVLVDHFVLDYGELAPVKRWIDDELDHRNLNDVCPYPTSAENLARWIYDEWRPRIPELIEVRVSETPKVWARYRPTTLPR
jgi:6-pyruvoyltetrahydropterin/6-carboxytetrahydropterin synthase